MATLQPGQAALVRFDLGIIIKGSSMMPDKTEMIKKMGTPKYTLFDTTLAIQLQREVVLKSEILIGVHIPTQMATAPIIFPPCSMAYNSYWSVDCYYRSPLITQRDLCVYHHQEHSPTPPRPCDVCDD